MELVSIPLSLMGMVLIIAPFAAFVIGGIFLVLFRLRRRRTLLVAAALWSLYGVYEYGMYLRILCSGECNIRVDLLLIYPLLLAVSGLGLLMFFLRHRDG